MCNWLLLFRTANDIDIWDGRFTHDNTAMMTAFYECHDRTESVGDDNGSGTTSNRQTFRCKVPTVAQFERVRDCIVHTIYVYMRSDCLAFDSIQVDSALRRTSEHFSLESEGEMELELKLETCVRIRSVRHCVHAVFATGICCAIASGLEPAHAYTLDWNLSFLNEENILYNFLWRGYTIYHQQNIILNCCMHVCICVCFCMRRMLRALYGHRADS